MTTMIDKFIQAAESAKLGVNVELTAAEALALVAEVTRLQRQRDEACADFDGLGPVIEGLEKAKAHIRADNERLFQRLREEEALAVKWQQRAEAAEAEASAACQEWDAKCQELEQQLMEIAEVLTATNVVSDFDDPVKLAHGIAEYCAGHHPGAAIRARRGDGGEEQGGESDDVDL